MNELQLKCNLDPNDEKCKFNGIKEINNQITTFSNKLREYNLNYHFPNINNSQDNIKSMLNKLEEEDNNLYNKFINQNQENLQEDQLSVLKNLSNNSGNQIGFNPEIHPLKETSKVYRILANFVVPILLFHINIKILIILI